MWAGSRTQPSSAWVSWAWSVTPSPAQASVAAEREVADDWGLGAVAECDDDAALEAGGLREQRAVAAKVGWAAGEPLVDRLEPAVFPGRLGVLGAGGTEGEALGVERAFEDRSAGANRLRGSAEFGDDGADVAQAREYTVELGLVGDRGGDGGGAVVSRVMSGSPSQADQWSSRWPSDADRVCRGCGVHERLGLLRSWGVGEAATVGEAGDHGRSVPADVSVATAVPAPAGAQWVTGCAAHVVAGASTVRACRRWSRHSERPRPIRATPVGTANGRLKDSGSAASARAEMVP